MQANLFTLVNLSSRYFLALIVLISLFACSSQLSEDSSLEQDDPAIVPARVERHNNAMPEFVSKMLREAQALPEHEQPLAITRYQYLGKPVYLVTPPCCDFFSKLYDAQGNLLGSPSGGITGKGDGSLTDFVNNKTDAYGIWKKGK